MNMLSHFCQGCGAEFIDKNKKGLCRDCKRENSAQFTIKTIANMLFASVIYVTGLVLGMIILGSVVGISLHHLLKYFS